MAALALTCAAVLTWVAAPPPARATIRRPSDGVLSPRLAELAKPAIRAAPRAKQARALSLAPTGPGSLLREGNRVLVEVRFDHGAAAGVDDLRATGARVVDVSARYQTVTAAAKPGELRQLARVSRVVGVTEVLSPIVYASECPAGAAVSEGVTQLHAGEATGEARAAFGVDGSGVTVGVLSDSFDKASEADDESGPIATHEEEDVQSGDLPGSGNTCAGQATPVDTARDDYTPGPNDPPPTDEGRAMAQTIHDVAPGAGLAFATASNGETAFADNIEELAKSTGEGGAGARVIVDDVAYFGEPYFQEGPIGVAVGNVVDAGVSYFSSAGNNNLVDSAGHDFASWEAEAFRDSPSGSCPAALPGYAKHCMDFNPSSGVDTTFGMTVGAGRTLTVDLQWAQPWNGVTTDLDAYLLSGGEVVAPASGKEVHNLAPSSQRPVEVLAVTNGSGSARSFQLAMSRCDTECDPVDGGDTQSPRVKFVLMENGGGVESTEYPQSSGGDVVGPTIFGHNGAAKAITVGAIPFNANDTPERFSSQGPVTHYFGPADGVTAAPPLSPAEVLSKPDLVATDCGVTTFFARFRIQEGVWRFCGTSAAAPHAAGVAALMIAKEGGAEPEGIRTALRRSASPVGSFGPCTVGAGLIEAVGAIEELLSPSGEDPAACTAAAANPWKVLKEETTPPPPIPVAPDGSQPNQLEPTPPPAPPAPGTSLLRRPPKTLLANGRTAKAVFRFASDQSGVLFLCKVDRARFHSCPARFARRYGLGWHVLRVKARNTDGKTDPTPVVYRFRVVQVRGR